MLSTTNDSVTPQSTSMINLHPNSIAGDIDSTGNSDPLPRRKSPLASSPIPPPLPPSRPTISHSKSLVSVSLNGHKICTEV